MQLLPVVFIYLVFAWFVGLWPFSDPLKSTELLPMSEYENVDLNAYFYFPDGKERYLGEYSGVSECQSAAAFYAHKNNISGNWGYVCCTIRNGSSCYEKIR
jgi:hypothetical protein